MNLSIYLAGAIRDGNLNDIAWREVLIENFKDDCEMLNPLARKTYDADTRSWGMSGVTPSADVIVPHDFWMVERADIIIFNLTALAEGYPNIGTLVEFGHATALSPKPLIYTIVEKGYLGHESTALFALHPFIAINSAIVFFSVDACLKFLSSHIGALNGDTPSFVGSPVLI